MAWLPIAYGDFYDIPHCVLVEHDNARFLLDAPFDEGLDGYPDHFDVYRLDPTAVEPDAALEDLIRSVLWDQLIASAQHVGRVSTNDVQFDTTRRRYIDDRVFDLL
jgi:hypothetical protein